MLSLVTISYFSLLIYHTSPCQVGYPFSRVLTPWADKASNNKKYIYNSESFKVHTVLLIIKWRLNGDFK